jgi:hypothetical protein
VPDEPPVDDNSGTPLGVNQMCTHHVGPWQRCSS